MLNSNPYIQYQGKEGHTEVVFAMGAIIQPTILGGGTRGIL
jgi:hypothetical protein